MTALACSTTEAQAIAQLCASDPSRTMLQKCPGYDFLSVLGRDDVSIYTFDATTAQLVGVQYTNPAFMTCYGSQGAACQTPSMDPCAVDGGAD